MDRISREYVRIARNLGVKNARVEGGDPHSRLCGTYKDQEVRMVISTSKGNLDRPRGRAIGTANIRRELKRIDGLAVCGNYRKEKA